ncbi:NADH-quinone oxidoreductase subunit L [Fodinibius sp.]|uniref:NADH-quinone oxidoreductase subunit 5 family protein n=1 Tax=Fodinibius sp. TaxID=1872440 RepID=UPI002ACDD369|nr:proton-conducting transporter membrane subunit [Fodinibius sp.]MDZ7660519.1 proton-conducting transporter membrane subunit [Fodinibius sp.]
MTALLLTILAPLAASLLILILRKKMGYIATVGALISVTGSILLYLSTMEGTIIELRFAGLPEMPFRLHATAMTATLSSVVSVITTFIFIYAIGYMAEQEGRLRFWSGITLFLGAMQLLVLSGDWILFVIAWEIMGFASYLLIGTWYRKKEASDAANKAFIMNRVADLGLYIGVFAIILTGGSSQISTEPLQVISTFGAMALLLAVMGKSAQVPFQSWLSSAMAGPTPVSALLHSATMVAAGIILLLKAFPLFSPAALIWIGSLGGLTILLTGATAIFSEDIKRMLAASTSSQLGFMVLAVGAGFPGAALAHLVAHAFMKSSLFLGAGIFQHQAGSTEYKQLQGLGRKMKWSFAGFALAGLALAGIPPFVGFWSKDAILAAGLLSEPAGWYFTAALAGAFFTAVYMGRAFGILWKGDSMQKIEAHHSAWMLTGLLVLVAVVISGGFYLEPMVAAAGFDIPKASLAVISGLAAAAAGLTAGWFVTAPSFQHRLWTFIQENYPVFGGYNQVVDKPMNASANILNTVEVALLQSVFGIGNLFLALASWLSETLDHSVAYLVDRFGILNLDIARLTQLSDDKGIVEWIAGLVDWVQQLGNYGRSIQSGLIHRELAWSVFGMGLALIILILTNL